MPRRKRKAAASSQWPPLTFVHSPKNDPPPLLLPDVGVDNPVTAKEVPIENLADISWVSPQFRRTRIAQLDRRKGSAVTSRGGNRGATTGRVDVSQRKSKLKALEFLADNNTNTNSSRNGVAVGSHVAVPAVLTSSRQECDNLDHSRREKRHSHTDSSWLKSKRTVRHLSVLKEKMHTLPEQNYQLHVEPADCVLEPEKDDRLCKENDLLLEQMHGNHLSSLNFSPVQTRRQDIFRNVQEESDVWSETAENMMNASAVSCNTPDLPSSPCDTRGTRTLRLDLFATPLRKSDTSESDILVVDTPEAEYDLTLRQRQIKDGFRSRLAVNKE